MHPIPVSLPRVERVAKDEPHLFVAEWAPGPSSDNAAARPRHRYRIPRQKLTTGSADAPVLARKEHAVKRSAFIAANDAAGRANEWIAVDGGAAVRAGERDVVLG